MWSYYTLPRIGYELHKQKVNNMSMKEAYEKNFSHS